MTKKTDAKGAVPANPTTHSTPKPSTQHYTLDSVIAAGGAHSEALRGVLFRAVKEADLLARGARIDTIHILDSIPDFFGSVREIYQGLSAQKKSLVV